MQPEHAFAAVAGMGILFFLFMAALVIMWIASLIDVITSDFQNPNNKTMWILLLLFLAPLATVLYLIIGTGQKVPKKAPERRPVEKRPQQKKEEVISRNGEWKF